MLTNHVSNYCFLAQGYFGLNFFLKHGFSFLCLPITLASNYCLLAQGYFGLKFFFKQIEFSKN